MKVIVIIALTAVMSLVGSSFASGPRHGGVVIRPFFPRAPVRGTFGHAPFRFFPNRVVMPSRFSFTPGWYGSYYYARGYYSPPYAYAPPYPYYSYPAYGYPPVPPPPAIDTSYDRGYSEGYTRGYEEAQKEINRLLDLEKTPSKEHEKSGD
ncbi:MAG TPA: hypothetical protein VFY96_02645 [Candidatus Binatia bacterium]|nr:hypothetical protein [Candidatus Binatia bacterium]